MKEKTVEFREGVLTIFSFTNFARELKNIGIDNNDVKGAIILTNHGFNDFNFYFRNFANLKKVTFGDKVQKISDRMFSGCSCLEEVVLPDSIVYIGEGAFGHCINLKRINIPEGVERIDDYAFYNCSSLKYIDLPSSLVEIGKYAFTCCENLRKIETKEGLRVIDSSAFARCSSLNEINLPSTLYNIGSFAFLYCESLENIKIPSRINQLSCGLFSDCSELKYVDLPSELRIIEQGTFDDCCSLEEINIPDSVIKIGDNTFRNCTSLQKVHLPENLGKIQENCFYCCSSLKEIEIPDNVVTISSNSFDSCKSLKRIVLPNSVTFIANRAFKDCSSLEEVVFPENMYTIYSSAFLDCFNIKKIVLPLNLSIINGNMLTEFKLLEEVVVREGTTFIPDFKFKDCEALKNVILPDSLEKIGEGAFKNCCSLENIKIPDKVEIIDASTFDGCSSLKHVRYSKKLNKLGVAAFDGCTSLKELVINKNMIVEPSSIDKLENLKLILELDNGNKIINVGENEFYVNPFGYLYMAKRENHKEVSFCYDGKFYESNREEVMSKIDINHNIKLYLITNYIYAYFWAKKNKFLPSDVVALNMPIKDIDLFYKNNNCNAWKEIVEKVGEIEYDNKVSLFKLCYVLGIFQENGTKRDKAVEFIKKHILNKLDQYVIHSQFDGFDLKNGFDPMWAEFFMKYYKDNPMFMYDEYNDLDLLCASYNNFDYVRKCYPNKTINTNRNADLLLPEDVFCVFNNTVYTDVDEGNEEFARRVSRYGYAPNQFRILQDCFNRGKSIKEEDMKIFISEDDIKDEDNISYELLAKDNPLGAVLGNITNCCQIIGGAGASCVEYGMSEPNSKFMIFNYKNNIIGQAWVWYDEKSKTVCLDNIEIPSKYVSKINHNENLQKQFIDCLIRVKDNFISEMENHGLIVNNVTIGEGYNDIKSVLNKYFTLEYYHINKLSDYNGYSDATNGQYLIDKNKNR